MDLNTGLQMAQSYMAATATPLTPFLALAGEDEADLVVVGGGCTGLSAALHAAERGLSVVVLEGGRIGWGASGRNGGQMIPGLRKGAHELVALYGRERGQALFQLALQARTLVFELIERHGIACDLRATGHFLGAVKARHMADLEAEVRCLQDVMRYPHAALLDAEAARDVVDTPYHGGLFDGWGGHLHPLNLCIGEARAAAGLGVKIAFLRGLVTSWSPLACG